MGKKDRFDSTEVEAEAQSVPEIDTTVSTKVFIQVPQTKVYTFAQWAKLNNRLDHHMGGMRAFLGASVNNKYPISKWDELMQAY